MAARHWLTVVVVLCGALAVTGAEAAAKKKAVAKGPPPVVQGAVLPRPQNGERDLFAVERKPLDSTRYRRAGLGHSVGAGALRRHRNPGHVLEARQEHQVQGLTPAVAFRRSAPS
jgi:hypothetical protein